MVTLKLILMISAFICFLLTAFNVVAPRISLLGLGLALWILAVLVQ